ncbi:hypothetical protein SCHPADRAFT_291788 [Schizopora paradoxa]|uniref:Uncharacterized protein n=1 Tax=Schizopora paradoxa TaxID=27342 RepID=A0A0H2SDB8_9AGAM|nr:hypothetical protein SCHPADRAFT_291788 [Schizopora paradoxa]
MNSFRGCGRDATPAFGTLVYSSSRHLTVRRPSCHPPIHSQKTKYISPHVNGSRSTSLTHNLGKASHSAARKLMLDRRGRIVGGRLRFGVNAARYTQVPPCSADVSLMSDRIAEMKCSAQGLGRESNATDGWMSTLPHYDSAMTFRGVYMLAHSDFVSPFCPIRRHHLLQSHLDLLTIFDPLHNLAKREIEPECLRREDPGRTFPFLSLKSRSQEDDNETLIVGTIIDFGRSKQATRKWSRRTTHTLTNSGTLTHEREQIIRFASHFDFPDLLPPAFARDRCLRDLALDKLPPSAYRCQGLRRTRAFVFRRKSPNGHPSIPREPF